MRSRKYYHRRYRKTHFEKDWISSTLWGCKPAYVTPTLLTQPSNLCIIVNHMHCIGASWWSISKLLERMKSWRLWRDWMCTDQLEWMESHPTYYVWSHQSPRAQQQSSHLTLDPYLYYLSLWMSLSLLFISNSTPTWQRNLCSTHVNQVLAMNTAPWTYY